MTRPAADSDQLDFDCPLDGELLAAENRRSSDLPVFIMAVALLVLAAVLAVFLLAGDPSLRSVLVTLCQAASVYLAKGAGL